MKHVPDPSKDTRVNETYRHTVEDCYIDKKFGHSKLDACAACGWDPMAPVLYGTSKMPPESSRPKS